MKEDTGHASRGRDLKKNKLGCLCQDTTVNVNTFSTTSIICLEIKITVKDEILEGR